MATCAITRQYSYNGALWRVRVTVVAVEGQQFILCVVDPHVCVNCVKILSVAQQCVMANAEYVAGNNRTY